MCNYNIVTILQRCVTVCLFISKVLENLKKLLLFFSSLVLYSQDIDADNSYLWIFGRLYLFLKYLHEGLSFCGSICTLLVALLGKSEIIVYNL